MKRVLPFAVSLLALALLAPGAGAVDKVPRPDKDIDTTSRPDPRPDLKPADQAPSKPQPPDKYDTFVDRNGNGVDDRRENLVTEEKPDSKTKPETKTNSPPDTVRPK